MKGLVQEGWAIVEGRVMEDRNRVNASKGERHLIFIRTHKVYG